jgi:sodium transport system ATP-binding protein
VQPRLAVVDVSHTYGDPSGPAALRGVSFQVPAGEVFALLGPNGAGKTTLLRTIAGVIRPSRGHAVVDGIRVDVDPLEARRRLGFLSGDTALYARLSVRETLDYFGALHGLAPGARRDAIARVTGELELGAFLDQRVATLSSGQRQRANLARAFISDPPVLVLDEPTVGLDVVSGEFLMQAIARARDRGKAVLFSTHVMSEVEALDARVGLLVRGTLRAIGGYDALLADFGVRTMTDLIRLLHRDGPDRPSWALPPGEPAGAAPAWPRDGGPA